ncbi:hypothetical protein, partial [Acrocarpospora macrocephala]|uniref:hypothetical protein n=1 Tax=Acrocarpospora macrocephala TaxID=150177 RepID=UPI0031DB2939
MAQAWVADAPELAWVVEASDQGGLAGEPAVGVADRECRELLSARDPGSAVFSELSNDHEEGLRELGCER